MKTMYLAILLFFSFKIFGQNSPELKQIDSLVKVINRSKITPQYDSIIRDLPMLGLYMKSNLTMLVNDSEVMKYVNRVKTVRHENGIQTNMITSSTFYFDRNELIKVEEFMIQD